MYLPTEYGPDISSETEIDQVWDAIDLDVGVVTFSGEWADQNGLPRSARFPWDESQGIYELAAFHGLHCLVGCIRPYS
jgi:hypothetical protein